MCYWFIVVLALLFIFLLRAAQGVELVAGLDAQLVEAVALPVAPVAPV